MNYFIPQTNHTLKRLVWQTYFFKGFFIFKRKN
jgi:hypothetical protein